MRLNHIDIAVNDVSAARAFLETYFDLHCIAERGTVAIFALEEDGVHCIISLPVSEHEAADGRAEGLACEITLPT
jgi:catechol-2,3-dioxygenase